MFREVFAQNHNGVVRLRRPIGGYRRDVNGVRKRLAPVAATVRHERLAAELPQDLVDLHLDPPVSSWSRTESRGTVRVGGV
jgi:hypothetical protein